jgi:hypothetical protein
MVHGRATCSGTIVELDERSAHVLTARHCVATRDGAPAIPFERMRVSIAVTGAWELRAVRRLRAAMGTGERPTWRGVRVDAHDWALVEIDAEPSMRAIPLDGRPLLAGEAVTVVTLRPQVRHDQPCPHERRFAWGDPAPIAMAGYSGAPIVAGGHVRGIFIGVDTVGLWFFQRVAHVGVVPAAVVAPALEARGKSY